MKKPEERVGEKYGKLTVLSVYRDRKRVIAICSCECGTQKTFLLSNVYRRKQSCGCSKREKISEAKTKHGHSARGFLTPTFRSWLAMRRRCNSPRAHRWDRYGGRGIGYCDRWSDFSNFLEDMGERPPGMSLDRLDNDGDYEPSNCKWSTQSEQRRNSSSAVWIEFGGMREVRSAWADLLGISAWFITSRMGKGIPFRDIFYEARRLNGYVT